MLPDRTNGFTELHDLRFVVPAIIILAFAMVVSTALVVPGLIRNMAYAIGSLILGLIAGGVTLFFPVHPGIAILVACLTVVLGPATLVKMSGGSIWDVIEDMARARRALRGEDVGPRSNPPRDQPSEPGGERRDGDET